MIVTLSNEKSYQLRPARDPARILSADRDIRQRSGSARWSGNACREPSEWSDRSTFSPVPLSPPGVVSREGTSVRDACDQLVREGTGLDSRLPPPGRWLRS